MKPGTFPMVTSEQFTLLDVLSVGACTGRELGRRLARRGVLGSEVAFLRLTQRLKKAGMLTASRIARDPGEYPGAQSRYEITEAGCEEVSVTRSFYSEIEEPGKEAENVAEGALGGAWRW